MYIIKVDDKTLYHPQLKEEGYTVLNPKLTFEVNKSGSLRFLLPPNNPRYNDITKLKSVITVLQNNEIIFVGRVLNDEKDFYNRKDVYCEGELSYLLDSIQRPYTHKGDISGLFNHLIISHNEQMDEYKKFQIGNVWDGVPTDDENPDPFKNMDLDVKEYPKTFDELTSKLVNVYGGYLSIRRENGVKYLDYIEKYTNKSDQVIEFGTNLIDLTELVSAEEMFTVLIPLGKENKTVKNAELEDGSKYDKDYIEAPENVINTYGRIYKTMSWNDISSSTELYKKATKYMKSKKYGLDVKITVKAIDLHILNVDTNRIKLGDNVRVKSIPHNLDEEFLCSKILIDMVKPDNTEFTLGYKSATLTDRQNTNVINVQNSVSVVQSTVNNANQTASQASQQVSDVVTQLEQYVKTETFDETMSSVSNTINYINDNVTVLQEGTSHTNSRISELETYQESIQNDVTFGGKTTVFERPITVPDVIVDKEWTRLTLENNFEKKAIDSLYPEYRVIGKHIYIRGSVQFPDDAAWGGSKIAIAALPDYIKLSTNKNRYCLTPCSGSRIARVIVLDDGYLYLEWIRKLSDGSNDTTTTGLWFSITVDYWID